MLQLCYNFRIFSRSLSGQVPAFAVVLTQVIIQKTHTPFPRIGSTDVKLLTPDSRKPRHLVDDGPQLRNSCRGQEQRARRAVE